MPSLAVILCGGEGARLWPLSNELRPKPFIRLTDGGHSIFQESLSRAAAVSCIDDIWLALGRRMFYRAFEECRQLELQHPVRFILEPKSRNTALAMAVVCEQLARLQREDWTLFFLPADHVIEDFSAWEAALCRAGEIAASGRLGLLALRPQRAETGYGYIELEDDGERVVRFIEKPDAQRAERFFSSGKHFWNLGVLVARVRELRAAFETYCPQILELARRALDDGSHRNYQGAQCIDLAAAPYDAAPAVSVEHALLERLSICSAVPCNFSWRDIGSWVDFSAYLPLDEQGNRVFGESMCLESSDCILYGHTRPIAALGVRDLLVVDSPNGLLVAQRGREQQVRELGAAMQKKHVNQSELGVINYRPWGTYEVLEVGLGYKIKRIVVRSGESLSMQRHQHRSEHWVVVAGRARVTKGEREFDLQVDQSIYIESGELHRLANLGGEDLVIVEVQTGAYLEEDDIERFDDKYSRVDEA